MSILIEYPKQVVVLRGTRTACGLRGRAAGLQRRLIDRGQSEDFVQYAHHLRKAKSGHLLYQSQLVELGKTATENLTRLLGDADIISKVIFDATEPFTKPERHLIRLGEPFTSTMIDKLIRVVMEVAIHVFRDHPNVNKLPSFTELGNTFIFRSSLC